MIGRTIIALLCARPALADTVLAARTIRPAAIIAAHDVAVAPGTVPGTFEDPGNVIGQEARLAIYPGRPIRLADVAPPALVTRNQPVTLVYATGGLQIMAEGRALGRGAAGARIPVMNLASRNTVTGEVQPNGTVHVR